MTLRAGLPSLCVAAYSMFERLLIAFLVFGMLGAAVGLAAREAGPTAVILLVGLAAFVPAWYLARKLVRPFQEVGAAADRVAEGQSLPLIETGPSPEGRDLARRFNAMSARLADRIDWLETEQQQLRAVLGGMVEGVVAVGPGQRVLFANTAAGRMLEFDPDAVKGRPLYEVSRQPAVQALIHKAIHSGQPQREDLEVAWSAGRHLSVYVAPLTSDSTGAVLVLHDTSDLRRLERLRQDFVANVSHELKTPLAVVRSCAEALLDGAADDPAARGPFLQQIADQSSRLHGLIFDLLSLARIESGAAALNLEAIPVGEAVSACFDRHRARAEAKRMTLTVQAPGEELIVWADDEALGQILDNLVDNAIKYTQQGGNVRASWAPTAGAVCVSIEDNGPGIPERELPRVFERFYRVDRARSRELGGTGLGLAIVKHLAQAMSGSVRASSEIGRGSTFTICLPTPEKANR